MGADEEKMKEAVLEREMKEKQSNLFKGLKFFLGREVPKEPLVFMIRAVGGEVSWDSSVGMGATFSQSDGSILIRLWIGTQTLWEKCSLEDSTSSLSGFLTVSIGERSAGRRIMYWEKLFLPTYLHLCQRWREESETMFHLNKRLLKRVKYRTWKMKIEMKRIMEI